MMQAINDTGTLKRTLQQAAGNVLPCGSASHLGNDFIYLIRSLTPKQAAGNALAVSVQTDREDEMKRLKGVVKYAGLLIAGCFLFAAPVSVYAAQYESLSPLLIDLEGWQAEPAEGMDMDMGGTKIIQAMRQYARNGKEADAMIMIGNTMMTMAHTQGMQSMNIETAQDKVKKTTIDGFQVSMHHSKVDNEGAVVVVLPGIGQVGAIFVFNYKGLNENDGLSTAKQFDWKSIEQQTRKLMQ